MSTTPDQIFAKAPGGGLRLLGQEAGPAVRVACSSLLGEEDVLAFLYGIQTPSRLLTQLLVIQEALGAIASSSC